MKNSQDSNKNYKTRPCKNGANCSYGDKCRYAHSQQELRAHVKRSKMPPPNAKSQVCKKWLNNECKYTDQQCWYLHEPRFTTDIDAYKKRIQNRERREQERRQLQEEERKEQSRREWLEKGAKDLLGLDQDSYDTFYRSGAFCRGSIHGTCKSTNCSKPHDHITF